jgi:hypothetical protein
MLLDPDALVATGRDRKELAEKLVSLAIGPTDAPDHRWLSAQIDNDGGVDAVTAVLDSVAEDVPDHKAVVLEARPFLSRLVTRRLQLQILREELPNVRTYIQADIASGAAATTKDHQFLSAAEELSDDASTEAVIRVFKACRVGQDRLTEELGSDRLTSLGTRGLAVATGALDTVAGERRVTAVRPLLKGVRMTLRFAHGVTSPAFKGSNTSKIALPTLAVLAAALLATGLVGRRGWALAAGAATALLALVIVAALAARGHLVSLTVGLLTFIALLTGGLWLVANGDDPALFIGVALAVVAGAVLAGLVLTLWSRKEQPPPPVPSAPAPPGDGGRP